VEVFYILVNLIVILTNFCISLLDAYANFSSRGGGGGRDVGPCYAFQRGECDRGNSCRFSHDVGGGGGGGGGRGGSRPICYKFQSGECDRGDGCRFSHDSNGGGGGGG